MSKSVSPRPIDSIFADSELIEYLRQKSKKIEPIQEFIRSFLDPELATEIIVASHGNDHIVILAKSPAWAAKIRYLVPLMLDNFSRHKKLNWVTEIRIKVLKYDQAVAEKPVIGRACEPSAKVRRHLKDFADSMPDKELSAALKRIAANQSPTK